MAEVPDYEIDIGRSQCMAEPTLERWSCCLPKGHDGPHGRYHPQWARENGIEQEWAEDWPVTTSRAEPGA